MKTEPLRNCDACGRPLTVIVYDVNVRVSVISGQTAQRLQGPVSDQLGPVSEIADLQLCPNCVCGLNSHALPLALDHRAQQLARAPRLPSHCQVYHWPQNPVKGTAA